MVKTIDKIEKPNTDPGTGDSAPSVERGLKRAVTKLIKADSKEVTDLHEDEEAHVTLSNKEVQKLRDKLVGYFKVCDENTTPVLTKSGMVTDQTESEPYTISGMTLALGFDSKAELRRYKKIPEFMAMMNWAMLRIEKQRNVQLLTIKGNPAGTIFDLKNNFGWSDNRDDKRIGLDLTLQEALAEISGSSRGLPQEKMEEKNVTKEVEVLEESKKPEKTKKSKKKK